MTVRVAASHQGGLSSQATLPPEAATDFIKHMEHVARQTPDKLEEGYTTSYHTFVSEQCLFVPYGSSVAGWLSPHCGVLVCIGRLDKTVFEFYGQRSDGSTHVQPDGYALHVHYF